MGPKYEFTDEIMNYNGHILHRIKRLSDGEIGGWIEKEENLSQDDNCWVDDEACVYDDALVSDNAKVYSTAHVTNSAKVYGDANICGNALVFEDACVYGHAKVCGVAAVSGNAQVYGNAKIYGYATVSGDAKVYGNAEVYDNACVYGYANIYGNAKAYGKAWVFSDVNICGDAELDDTYYNDSEEYGDEESSKEVIQDFIYIVNDSNKLNIKTEYNSVDEFFNAPITNDIKLNTLVIYTVDTKMPLIKLEKIETENKLNYRFIVDISIDNGDNFSIKSTIKTQEQLNQKLEQTIEALKQYPEFSKYADDLEDCL
jgi:hypothetical protein